MSHPAPKNEAARLEALRQYQLLDTEPEQAFDDFALLASNICGTPIATVTLLDETRQWFKAKIGLENSESPREHAFCSHTILSDRVMVVEDATRDTRFAENPLVTGAPNIRFYAGAPLINRDGFGIGTLCAIDRKPRYLTTGQQQALEALARLVVAQCEFRRVSAQLAEALGNVKQLQSLLPICAHCKAIRSDEGYWQEVATYIHRHAGVDFSHGICPQCIEEHHPAIFARMVASGKIKANPK